MKSQKLLRIAGFIGLGLVVLGAAGYAANGGGRDESATAVIEPAGPLEAPDDSDVIASINRSLGFDAKTADVAPVPPATDKATLPMTAQSREAQSSAGAGGSTGVAPAPSAPGGESTSLATDDGRKIVQTASLKLQVKDVGDSFAEVGRIATGAGGFVASSNSALQGETQVATVSIRVPAKSYQDVLGQLRALGVKIDSETSNASDVTEEYSDLAARIRTLEATEGTLMTLLGNAKTINEVLQVQDRLNTTRNQIEQAKGRQALLDKLSDLATISVGLRPVATPMKSADPGTGLGAAVTEAWDDSLEFLGGIAEDVVTVLVFAWWVPVVGLPAYAIGRRYLRSRPAPLASVD